MSFVARLRDSCLVRAVSAVFALAARFAVTVVLSAFVVSFVARLSIEVFVARCVVVFAVSSSIVVCICLVVSSSVGVNEILSVAWTVLPVIGAFFYMWSLILFS